MSGTQLSDEQLITLGEQIWDLIHELLDNESEWNFCEDVADVKMYKCVKYGIKLERLWTS